MSSEKLTESEAACVAALQKSFPPSTLDADDVSFLSDSTYLRFARARNGDVAKASEMLKNAIAWRKEARPYAITEQEVEKAMSQDTLVCGGRDKEGNPVMAMVLGMKNDCTVEQRLQQVLYVLEETQRKGYDRLTWIVDFGAMGKQRDERSKETRKQLMKILQDYYPERMAHILIFRPPWYISWLMGLALAFMDRRTAAKTHKVGSTIEELEKYVDRSQVPTVCGGTLERSSASVLAQLPALTASSEAKAPPSPIGRDGDCGQSGEHTNAVAAS